MTRVNIFDEFFRRMVLHYVKEHFKRVESETCFSSSERCVFRGKASENAFSEWRAKLVSDSSERCVFRGEASENAFLFCYGVGGTFSITLHVKL